MGSDSRKPTNLDDFVISTGLKIPEGRIPLPLSTTPDSAPHSPAHSIDANNLYEAVQQLGTALRKERAYSHQTVKELEESRAAQTQVVSQYKKQIHEILLREQQLKGFALREQEEKKQLRSRFTTLEQTIQQLQTEIRQSSLREKDEKEKVRFEQELQKTTHQYNLQRIQQLQTENNDLKQELTKLRNEHQQLARSQQEHRAQVEADGRAVDVHQQSLLRKIAELNTELAQYRAGWANQVDLKARAESLARQQAQMQDGYQRLSAEHARLKAFLANSSSQVGSAKTQVSQIQTQLDAERNDKHMVLATLRATEIKLDRAESRARDLEIDLERLRETAFQTRKAPPQPEPKAQPPVRHGAGAVAAPSWNEEEETSPEALSDWPNNSMSEEEFWTAAQKPVKAPPAQSKVPAPQIPDIANYIVAYPAISGEA